MFSFWLCFFLLLSGRFLRLLPTFLLIFFFLLFLFSRGYFVLFIMDAFLFLRTLMVSFLYTVLMKFFGGREVGLVLIFILGVFLRFW